MRANNLWSAIAIGGAFVVSSLLSYGCGNPEEPQITNVRLSYLDSIPPDPEPDGWAPLWVPVENGSAPQSPVRVEGNVTDNTAVVNPRITWIGERGDVDVGEDGFTECSEGPNAFYSCEMECEGPAGDGYFECTPALDAPKLIRGDRFVLTGTQADGAAFELEVSVSEAQDLTEDLEYRIFRVSSLEGDSGLIWSVYQKTDCGTWDWESEVCRVDESLRALRSGDSLCWQPASEQQTNCSFQIALKNGVGEDAIDSVTAAWSSLVKWNNEYFLNWDAKTGDFEQTFQLFDPRQRYSGQVITNEGQPTYRFVASAQDVPDQKTEVYRSAEKEVSLIFSPQEAVLPPDLEVDGEDEELIETSNPAENIGGKVQSISGEARSLVFSLSGPEGNPRFLYFDPESISLQGNFVATLVYVSDWDGDGVVDPLGQEGGIRNDLEVAALDVQGNPAQKTVSISFVPTTGADRAPDLQILEIFPAIDGKQEVWLPFDEELRVRARAADDRGQPAFLAYQCDCATGQPQINDDLCSECEPLTRDRATEQEWVDLNAGGEYPLNPWEWIVVQPNSGTPKTIGVLLAKEKVEDPKDFAKFTGIVIDLDPQSEEEAKVSVSQQVTTGPVVTLLNPKNGDIIVPSEGFIVEAMIPSYPISDNTPITGSELNRIIALWNNEPRGDPEYDSTKGYLSWDLTEETVQEGDRICVGAISVTGHATLNLLEFAATTSEDSLVLWVTVTPNTEECGLESP